MILNQTQWWSSAIDSACAGGSFFVSERDVKRQPDVWSRNVSSDTRTVVLKNTSFLGVQGFDLYYSPSLKLSTQTVQKLVVGSALST